jgi:hypothetical protein
MGNLPAGHAALSCTAGELTAVSSKPRPALAGMRHLRLRWHQPLGARDSDVLPSGTGRCARGCPRRAPTDASRPGSAGWRGVGHGLRAAWVGLAEQFPNLKLHLPFEVAGVVIAGQAWNGLPRGASARSAGAAKRFGRRFAAADSRRVSLIPRACVTPQGTETCPVARIAVFCV